MSENQEISLNSVKKLIATKCPSVKIKNPALNAISICAENVYFFFLIPVH